MSYLQKHHESDNSDYSDCFCPDLQDDLYVVEEKCCPVVCEVPNFKESCNDVDSEGEPFLGLKGLFSDGVIRTIPCEENSCYEEVCRVKGECNECPVYDCGEVLRILSKGMVPYDRNCPLKNIAKVYRKCCVPLHVDNEGGSFPGVIKGKVVTTGKTFSVDLNNNPILVNNKRSPNIHIYKGKTYTFKIAKESAGHALFFSFDANGFSQIKELGKLERGQISFFVSENTPKKFYYMDYNNKNKVGIITVH